MLSRLHQDYIILQSRLQWIASILPSLAELFLNLTLSDWIISQPYLTFDNRISSILSSSANQHSILSSLIISGYFFCSGYLFCQKN